MESFFFKIAEPLLDKFSSPDFSVIPYVYKPKDGRQLLQIEFIRDKEKDIFFSGLETEGALIRPATGEDDNLIFMSRPEDGEFRNEITFNEFIFSERVTTSPAWYWFEIKREYPDQNCSIFLKGDGKFFGKELKLILR